MKKFRFNLETVLEYRRELEKRKLAAVSEAQVQVRRCQEMVHRLRERFACSRLEFARALSAGRVDPRLASDYCEYLEALAQQVGQAADALREATRTFEVRLNELTAAQRDVKVVARLREKAFTRFRREVEREEQKQTDEAALTRFARANAQAHADGAEETGGSRVAEANAGDASL